MILTDTEINQYLQEEKKLKDKDFKEKVDRGNKTTLFEVKSKSGNKYILRIRNSKSHVANWSVILSIIIKNKEYILTRYNGNYHAHTNSIEKNSISGFHIHHATERYQEKNYKIDGYATATSEYSTISGAIKKMIRNLHISIGGYNSLNRFIR
jgi:hypothetical protein